MKKLILSAAFLAFAGIASVQANSINPVAKLVAVQDTVGQDSSATPVAETTQNSDTKTAMKLGDLPEAVKTTLTSDAYKGWTPSDVFLVTSGDKKHYEITMKNEDKTGVVKIKEDGTAAE